tara:strand:+ start:1195 stop:1542 length:348 start_codon:yes stop_codon:yes gene_type:complete
MSPVKIIDSNAGAPRRRISVTKTEPAIVLLMPVPPAIDGIPPSNFHHTNEIETRITTNESKLEGITGIIPPNHIKKKNGKTIPNPIVPRILPILGESPDSFEEDTATATTSSAGC